MTFQSVLKVIRKINPLYLILGLLTIIFINSALGSQIKEGMTSATYTKLKEYQTSKNAILNNIVQFVRKQQNKPRILLTQLSLLLSRHCL